MNMLIIFGARYLLFVSVAIAAFYLLKQPRKRQKEILFFAVVLLPLSYITAKIISRFYFDPRPFVVGNFTPLILHKADNGFPSDHTLLGAAIAFAIFRFDVKPGLFLLFLALLTGFARVFAGVHHPADIAGSVVIVATVYLIIYTFRRSNLRNEKYAQKSD